TRWAFCRFGDPPICSSIFARDSKKCESNRKKQGSYSTFLRAVTRQFTAMIMVFFQRENGYIAHPIPTPIKRKRNSDHTMYFARSIGRRRLRKPKAMEIS